MASYQQRTVSDENCAPTNAPKPMMTKRTSKSQLSAPTYKQNTPLVGGTVDRIKHGESGFNPVLQVIQVRRKAEIGLTLGDGEKFIEAVLPPNLANIVADGHVQESSFVTLTSFFCTTVDQKSVLILMGLEVFDETPAVTAPSGSRSRDLQDEEEDLPQRLGRKSKSFGQGSRDWFDAMPTPLNSSLSKEIAKAKADGADIEKVLPLLMQGKLYESIRQVPETQKGIFDYDPSAPEDAPSAISQKKSMKDTASADDARSRKVVPVSRQSLGAAVAPRSSIATAAKSRQSVGAAPRSLKKSEPEPEAEIHPEEKKRGLLTRLFGIGKSSHHDSHPKVSRSVSVGQMKGKGTFRGKSKVTKPGRDDDDDVAPPPEEEYIRRR